MSFTKVRSSPWLPLVAAMAIIAFITAITASSPSPPGPAMSPYNTGGSGGAAAYRWLADIGYHPRSVSSLDPTSLDPSSTTVLLLEPGRPMTSRETSALLAWVKRGGVVVGGPSRSARPLMRSLRATVLSTPPGTVRVTEPLVGKPAVGRVSGRSPAVLEWPRGTTVLATRRGPVLSRGRVGRGTVWLLAARRLLSNNLVGSTGNAILLTTLVGPRGRTVVFVELQPRIPAASRDWLTGVPWGLAGIFAVTVLLLYRWLSGWRLGPPLRDRERVRRPATDYVIAMGRLLHRARGRSGVLAMYQERLRRLATNRRHPVALPERLVAPAEKLSEPELLRRCREIVAFERESLGERRRAATTTRMTGEAGR